MLSRIYNPVSPINFQRYIPYQLFTLGLSNKGILFYVFVAIISTLLYLNKVLIYDINGPVITLFIYSIISIAITSGLFLTSRFWDNDQLLLDYWDLDRYIPAIVRRRRVWNTRAQFQPFVPNAVLRARGAQSLNQTYIRYFSQLPIRISKQNFRKIKRRIVTKKLLAELNQDKLECSICLENIRVRQACSILSCKHIFHTKCVRKWLTEKCTTPNCPCCRADIRI